MGDPPLLSPYELQHEVGDFWYGDMDVIGWEIGSLDLLSESQCNFDDESDNSFQQSDHDSYL